jgi:hypothetical protein
MRTGRRLCFSGAGKAEFGTGGNIELRNMRESTSSLCISSVSVFGLAATMLMDWTAYRMHSTWASFVGPVVDFRT